MVKTTTERISELTIIELMLEIWRLSPRIMKKIIKKKSRSGFILELISVLYGEIDKIIPAVKAPISIENPKKLNNAAIRKHHVIENKNNTSCDLAIFPTIFGRIKNPINNKITINATPVKRLFVAKELKLFPFEIEEININTATATKSWTIRIPIEIFP